MDEHHQQPPEAARILAGLGDAVAVLGPDATLTWVNDELVRLLGTARHDLIGTPGFDLLHPDELDRAVGGIAYSAQFPDRTAVVRYRVRRGDGSWFAAELKSAVVAGPGGDSLVLVVRDATTRERVSQALAAVAGGRPLAETCRHAARSVSARWPHTAVVISWSGPQPEPANGHAGDPSVEAGHGDGRAWLVDALGEVGADALAPLGRCCRSPEGVFGAEVPVPAGATGPVVVRALADLPEATATEARRCGFEGCVAALVRDPAGEPALVVVWVDHLVIADLEVAGDLGEALELVALALERRHHLDRLAWSARHDALTGLVNRAGFFDELERHIGDARARSDVRAGLLYVDLDGFKEVNDRHGHRVGDHLLRATAERLRSAARTGDVVARLGGDEFVVLGTFGAAGATEPATTDAVAVARRVVSLVDAPLDSPAVPTQLRVGASVGIALDDRVSAPQRLLDAADAAMYRAKAEGRGRWSVAPG